MRSSIHTANLVKILLADLEGREAFLLLRSLQSGEPLGVAIEIAFEENIPSADDQVAKIHEYFAHAAELVWFCQGAEHATSVSYESAPLISEDDEPSDDAEVLPMGSSRRRRLTGRMSFPWEPDSQRRDGQVLPKTNKLRVNETFRERQYKTLNVFESGCL